jgi:uncharacterized membrane protein
LLVIVAVALILSWASGVSWEVPVAVAIWDVVALALLFRDWRIIMRSDPERARRRATAEDPGRIGLLVIVIVASIISIIAATVLIAQAENSGPEEQPWLTWLLVALGAGAVLSAWAWVHTAFTLHYARLYYQEGGSGGLKFPDEDEPDDLDFAYLAFMIGIGYQSADVDVSHRSMRLATLVHGVISFIFNTAILALVVNVFFDLLK